MHIGFDATALPANPVGAGRYIIYLARHLAQRPEIDQLSIVVQRARLPFFGNIENERTRLVVVADRPISARLVWEQVVLPKLVRRLRVDVFHSPHYTMPFLLPCRSVVTFHDMTFFLFPELHTRPKRLLFPQYIRASARRADALIADSNSTRQDAIRLLKLSPDRITAIPLGITPDFKPVSDPAQKEALRQKYHLPERFIIYVGAVEPRKNLPFLLRAFQTASPHFPEWKLVLVGRLGWMYQDVLEQIDTPELRGRVLCTGYVPQEDLPGLYSLAGVFVYPSVYEGFGLPVLEALACGVPVITTNVSSMPEITGEAAVLLPPNDEQSLVQALLDLVNDDRRRVFSALGVQRAAQFTWDATARETVRVYQKIFGPKILG